MSRVASLPVFRQLAEARSAANDAMVAMLVAGEISTDFLQDKGDARLTTLFPALPSRKRLDRTASDALPIIEGAERHLAGMAIAYAISIHHRGMSKVLASLGADGKLVRAWRKEHPAEGEPVDVLKDIDPYDVKLVEVHAVFRRTTGAEAKARDVFDPRELGAFQFARQLRNRLAHQGATAGANLKSQWEGLPDSVQTLWTDLARREFPIPKSGEPLELGSGELFAVLAICKRLEDAAEREVVGALSDEALADIVVADYASSQPHRMANDHAIERRLYGFLARRYKNFATVDASDLLDARKRRLAQG